MAIETIDDIVEELADKFGIYAPIPEGDHPDDCQCRMCFTAWMKRRIVAAAEVERKLER